MTKENDLFLNTIPELMSLTKRLSELSSLSKQMSGLIFSTSKFQNIEQFESVLENLLYHAKKWNSPPTAVLTKKFLRIQNTLSTDLSIFVQKTVMSFLNLVNHFF
jgi:hypothetical protein